MCCCFSTVGLFIYFINAIWSLEFIENKVVEWLRKQTMEYILFSLSRSSLYPGIYVLSLGRGLFSSVTSKKDFPSFLTVWVPFFSTGSRQCLNGKQNWEPSQDGCVADRMSSASCSTGKEWLHPLWWWVISACSIQMQKGDTLNTQVWIPSLDSSAGAGALISQLLQRAELLRQCSFLPLSCSSVKPDLKDKTNHLRQHCCKSRGINCHPEPSSCSWPLKLYLQFSFLWFALWMAVVTGISFAEKGLPCSSLFCDG